MSCVGLRKVVVPSTRTFSAYDIIFFSIRQEYINMFICTLALSRVISVSFSFSLSPPPPPSLSLSLFLYLSLSFSSLSDCLTMYYIDPRNLLVIILQVIPLLAGCVSVSNSRTWLYGFMSLVDFAWSEPDTSRDNHETTSLVPAIFIHFPTLRRHTEDKAPLSKTEDLLRD